MTRLAIVLVALAAVPAHANVGKATYEGTRTSEPTGLHGVAIVHEQLGFDLRPLAAGNSASVSAIYELDNQSAAIVTAPLVLVSGSRVEHGITVTFDQAEVRGEPATQAHESDADIAMAFTLAIAPGRHRLAVSYDAWPERDREHGGGTLIHQLGYALAPARDWGAFGTLDVSIDAPAGWRVTVAPALARTGDTLRGQFTGLPADTLGITARAPPGTLHAVLQIALPVLALFALVGGGLGLFALGRARRADDLRPLWPVSLPVSLVWGIAIAISGSCAAIRADLAIPEHQSASYGYAAAFGILCAVAVGVVAIPAGVLLARAGSRPPPR